MALVAIRNAGFGVGALVSLTVLPSAAGTFLLMSDAVFDVATAEQRRRASDGQ